MFPAGEAVALSPEAARRLTDQIKTAVEAVWELVIQAYQARAWAALGYSTWDDYCTREFGSCRLRLPREERQEVVTSLRAAGLSSRAIAAATGNAQNTVLADLGQVRQVHQIDAPDQDVVDAELLVQEPMNETTQETTETSTAPPAKPALVQGTDGKSYPSKPSATSAPKGAKRAPAALRRRPLTKDLDTAGWDLRRAVDRIVKLCADDRFSSHAIDADRLLRAHLEHTTLTCSELLTRLDQNKEA